MKTGNYILKDKIVVYEPDIMKWGKWFANADRIVGKTNIGDVEVSTVFLGIDHNYSGDGSPLLFETMVFGGVLDQEMDRYSTWGEAELGHSVIVEEVQSYEKSDKVH
tara:strand:+ start:322 stop:642 length:321 start_codon:yes stop_codon:yes gene_type:complete